MSFGRWTVWYAVTADPSPCETRPPAQGGLSAPRPLDAAQAYFWLLDQVSPMNFAAIAEGEGPLDTGLLRQALRGAQMRHPVLASAIVRTGEGGLAWVACESPVVLQQEPPVPSWRHRLAQVLQRPFEPGQGPLLRACRFDLPGGRWVLALVFHHSAVDGRSGCRLLADLLLDMCRPSAAAAAAAPVPVWSMHDLYPARFRGVQAEALVDELRALRRSEFAQQGRPEPMPGFVSSARRACPVVAGFRLGSTSLQQLMRNCRQRGTTVHGALGAAQLMALRSRFDDSTPCTLALSSPIDMRPHLGVPVDDAQPACCLSMATTPVRMDGGEGFWWLAGTVSRDIRRQVERGDAHLFYRFVPGLETCPATPAGLQAFAGLVGRVPQNSLLSNVGRLANAAAAGAAFRVENISFALIPLPHQPLFTAASTYAGRLTVNLCFDEARLPPAAFCAIGRRMQGLIEAAATASGEVSRSRCTSQ